MKLIQYLLLVFVAKAIDSYFSEKYVTHIKSKEIRYYIEKPDYMTVFFLYNILDYKSIMLGEILLPMLPEYKDYIKFYSVSCEDDPDFCTPEIKFEMPVIQAFIPKGISPLTNKPVIVEKSVNGDISVQSLIDFFVPNIPYLGDFIDQEYIEEFLAKENNKLILFNKDDEVIKEFKALSSKYWGRLELGVIYINQTELLDRFEIYRFPSIVVVNGKDIMHYEGLIDLDEIVKFVDKFKSSERKQVAPRRFLKEYFDEDYLVYLPEFPTITANLQQLEDELAKDNQVTLVHFYKEAQHPAWEDLQLMYAGIVKLVNFHIENSQDEDYAKVQNVKKFPVIRVFPSNRKRKSIELDLTDRESIEEEITKELKPDIKILQDGTVSLFIESANIEYKVGFLLISNGKIPITIKGLAKTDHFKHFASFGYYNKPKEEALKKFTISKYPSFVAVIKQGPSGGLRVLEYKGRLNDFRSLYYFVDELALPTLLPESIPMPAEEDFDPVIKIRSSSQFVKFCQLSPCAVTLFDGIVKFI